MTLHNIERLCLERGSGSSRTTFAPDEIVGSSDSILLRKLTISQVSFPSRCCLGSYLNRALFCEGGNEVALEVKLTKLLGLSTFTFEDWFFEIFLGERLFGKAPRALGGELG